MIIKEYRIVLPLSFEEYEKGLLYMIAKASKEESTSGVPMRVLVNEPFENEIGKGLYTHRVLSIANRLPEWLKKLFIRDGSTTFQVEEKSWNAFPFIKTIYTCPLFSEEKFEIIVITRHQMNEIGLVENIHNLKKTELKQRLVDFIDISQDTVDKKYYKQREDPRYYKSRKTQRGPLKYGWQKSVSPVMCAYKLVSVKFSYLGQSRVEKLLQDVIRNIYLTTHRQLFCWIDEWFDLSYNEILSLEYEQKEESLKDTNNIKKIDKSKSFSQRYLKSKL